MQFYFSLHSHCLELITSLSFPRPFTVQEAIIIFKGIIDFFHSIKYAIMPLQWSIYEKNHLWI